MFDRIVAVRGAGDIASGVIHRLHMCGFKVVALELEKPMSIRRRVSFSEAVYEGETQVEGVRAVLANGVDQIKALCDEGCVAVIVDPQLSKICTIEPDVIVDATLCKRNYGMKIDMAPVTIGVGPGFFAGVDVEAVVETLRGHELGRVIYKGSARRNTGIPASVCGCLSERVLRAPESGRISNIRSIGDFVKSGDVIASVMGVDVKAQIDGVVRGLIRDGSIVSDGLKIGDIDPRGIYDYCFTISEKARAVAGGVLEAMLHLMSNQ